MRLKIATDKVRLFSYFILPIVVGSIVPSLPFVYKDSVPACYSDALFASAADARVTGLSTAGMNGRTNAGFWAIMIPMVFGGLGLLSFFARNIAGETAEKAFRGFVKSRLVLFFALIFSLQTGHGSRVTGRHAFPDLPFETFSSFGTVGLSLGVTPGLSFLGKPVATVTVVIGRAGIFSMALGFPRREREQSLEHPSVNTLV
jgi:Trk-type K+ transport system membrane component